MLFSRFNRCSICMCNFIDKNMLLWVLSPSFGIRQKLVGHSMAATIWNGCWAGALHGDYYHRNKHSFSSTIMIINVDTVQAAITYWRINLLRDMWWQRRSCWPIRMEFPVWWAHFISIQQIKVAIKSIKLRMNTTNSDSNCRTAEWRERSHNFTKIRCQRPMCEWLGVRASLAGHTKYGCIQKCRANCAGRQFLE